MKKRLFTMMAIAFFAMSMMAQSHSDRISLGMGALYERGFDATLSWEHETGCETAGGMV